MELWKRNSSRHPMKLSKMISFFQKHFQVNIIRLFMHLWPTKGKLSGNRLVMAMDVLFNLVRKLLRTNKSQGALTYGDHEFSFHDTPTTRVKMHRATSLSSCFKMPCIPSINRQADCSESDSESYEEGIDEKAEKFINRFYEDMHRQRQHELEMISTVK